MKKIRIIALLFILAFSFSVKAEVFMEIDCNGKEVTNKGKITCEGNLVYEEVSIDDVDFEYVTNLDIEFLSLSGFTLNKNGNKVSIHSATPLYDDIMSSTVIMKFTLQANDNSSEKESITFRNFKINKSSDEIVDDVSKTFNVSLEKVLDSTCTLDNITIDKVNLKDFDKNKLEYKVTVNKSVISIDAKRTSDKSSATGLGEEFIKPGETIEHDIEVVAEDNTKKVYKLFITNENSETLPDEEINSLGMELSNDNTLKLLELYNGKEKIPFTFNNKKDTFDISISNSDLKKITIKAETNHNKATFIDKFGPRDIDVKLGNNKVLIKVKAENKDEKVYTLNIELKEGKSNDNTLSFLKINDEVVSLINDIDTYDITLPNDALKTKIEAIANSEKAKVDFEDTVLTDGKNEVIITVTAENNDKREYHINISLSDKVKLTDIKVEGYNLGFSKSQEEYILKINNDLSKLEITINPTGVDYEILGNEKLENGSVIKIKVDDINGPKEYKITILKESSKSIFIYGGIILLAIVIAIAIIYLIRKKRKSKMDIEVI